jgi:hypothetical protein
VNCGLSRLAYLASTFCRLSELNNAYRVTALHSQSTTKQKLSEKIGFIVKEAGSGQVLAFPFLDSSISENETQLNPKLAANIKEHYENLIADFKEFFTENLTSESWIRNPFSIDELIEPSCDGSLQKMFKKMDFTEFWLARRKENPLISDKAVTFLLVFITTYICECEFSLVVYRKNKYRNRLSTEHDLRLKLTKTEPDTRKLHLAKQAHPSQ